MQIHGCSYFGCFYLFFFFFFFFFLFVCLFVFLLLFFVVVFSLSLFGAGGVVICLFKRLSVHANGN